MFMGMNKNCPRNNKQKRKKKDSEASDCRLASGRGRLHETSPWPGAFHFVLTVEVCDSCVVSLSFSSPHMNKPIHLSEDHAEAILRLLKDYAEECSLHPLIRAIRGSSNHIYVTNMAKVLQKAIKDSEKGT
jgi:hypothetical protein